jgi:hypothetical protein
LTIIGFNVITVWLVRRQSERCASFLDLLDTAELS